MKKLFLSFLVFLACFTVRAEAQVSFFLLGFSSTGGIVSNGATIDSLTEGSVTNAATMPINLTSYIANYNVIIITITVIPVTDGSNLDMLVSPNGSSYDNSSGDYQWGYNYGTGYASGTSAALMQVAGVCGGAAGMHTDGTFVIQGANNASAYPLITGQVSEIATGSDGISPITFVGERNTVQITKAVEFLMSSGNITGSYKVFGMKN